MRCLSAISCKRPGLRLPLVVLAVLAVAGLAWWLLRPAPTYARTLPQLTLERLEGGQLTLSEARGQPVVVNLWATWCPPCRRELPMLAAAAKANPDVRFYFADQGEAKDLVEKFLAERPELGLQGVLLDGGSQLSNAFGAVGLPVTLFFDASGNHVLSHMGEVSEVDMLNYLTDLKRGKL